jgi:hypothetical protein
MVFEKWMAVGFSVVLIFVCGRIFAEEKAAVTAGVEVKRSEPDWKTKGCVVETKAQMVYDLNGNGWLEPDEAKKYLNDRYHKIFNYADTGVDSDLLRAYDTNANGAIDPREAQAIREDCQN